MRQFSRVTSAAINGRLLVLAAFSCLVACGHGGETNGTGTPQGGGTGNPQGGSNNPGAGGSTSSTNGGNTNSTNGGNSNNPQGGSGEVTLKGGSGNSTEGGSGNGAGNGNNGGQNSSSGGTNSTSGGMTSTGTMSCGDSSLPEDKTRPGYAYTRAAEVTSLLSSMAAADKVKQMFGVANPANHDSAAYNDIERSQDVPSGNGSKTVRGYRYRDAGRGVNLAAGQDNRPSAGKDYSTAFPTESARAASWDVDLEYRLGVAMGDETMGSKNNMLLAPCMNIVRHPYWGRTQETYSEDMYHTGRMASALTAGLQTHVIACAKHYAANNIENNRAGQNATMDEQTLREIYGRHFEMVVRDGGIGCIMASYNSINGKKSTQNQHLLTDILRGDVSKGGFGFKGIVLSDWWAMPGDQMVPDTQQAQNLALEAVKAGLDIELPWSLHYSQIGALVSNGSLSQADVDAAAGRVLDQKLRFNSLYTDSPWGLGTAKTSLSGDSITGDADNLALCEEAEIKSAVLLKNGTADMPVLPIKGATSIAVVGLDLPLTVTSSTKPPPTGTTMHFATDPNVGDRGSSRVNADPAKSVGPFAGIKTAAAAHGITNVTSGNSVTAAMGADFIVVVVGLSAGDEGEEYSIDSHGDRKSLTLPGNQEKFVSDVLALNKPTAIIIESGNIVNLPWLTNSNTKQATIWAGYPGQRGGDAFGKLLMGDKNFSGKMPMAWPKESDMPPFTTGASSTQMDYFFGYRYYDSKGMSGNLVFPFGQGLSYSTFKYANLKVPCSDVTQNGVVNVTVEISNTSSVEGDEIAMLFIKPPPKPANIKGNRPVKELKSFYKVNLKPMGMDGSAKQITLPVRIQDLRRWEGDANGSWVIDPGTYTVMVGPNADEKNLTLTGTFDIKG